MTTDLVPVPAVTASSVLEMVPEADRLVARIAQTSFVPKAYRNKPDELLAAILTGYELGLPPMTAMSKVHNIEGTASLSAEAMRALVLSKGHDLWIEDASDSKVVVGGRRAGSEKASLVTWTIDMAQKAGLTNKQNWRRHPQQMLLARATAQLCRTIFPDCLAGISFSMEEVQDGDVFGEDAEPGSVGERPADAPKPKPASRARKAPSKKSPSKPAPKPAAAVPDDPLDDFDAIDGLDRDVAVAAARPSRPAQIDGDAPVDDRPVEERRAQMLAIRTREVLGDLDRDDRLAVYAHSTGRIVKSGKDLTSEDVDRVLVDLDRVAAGELRLHGRRLVETGSGSPDDEIVEAELVEDDDDRFGFGSEGSWSVDDWMEFLSSRGVSPAKALKQARSAAGELGRELPTSLEVFAEAGDQEVAQLVRAWVEGEAR